MVNETQNTNEAIAIIGMSCRFAGANNPREYWNMLANGLDVVGDLPEGRWDLSAFYDPDSTKSGKTISRWGAYLENLDQFDATFFEISPREAATMDPRQRLVLEGAWEALEDAGLAPERVAGSRTGVFVAVLSSDYGTKQFSDYETISAHSGSGTANSTVANRISYALDLRGPSVVMDTACSGSLVAVHQACQSLRAGESELALAGGVNVILLPDAEIFFSRAGILSPDGRCKTFDRRANGIVRAEGMGLLVLKPLARALADKDRVYAVIRGTAVNHMGRGIGILAPSQPGQEAVLRAAYANAGVNPAHVQYIEAHGTGTSIGDPIEVNALGVVLGPGRAADDVCHLGSAKTNMGHSEAAAGVAGMIKVALAMQARLLPPNLHFSEPNPAIPFDRLPFIVQQVLGPWPQSERPLLAGVSSFGFTGTNAHVVMEAAPAPTFKPEAAAARPYILPLSGKTPAALNALVQTYQAFLKQAAVEGPAELTVMRDIASMAARGRNHAAQRMAVVGSSLADWQELLQAYLTQQPRMGLAVGAVPLGNRPGVVWVFSGQGAHWLGMGRELMRQEPVVRAKLEACDAILQELAGWSILEVLQADTDATRLNDTCVAQPAITAMQIALAALWTQWGIVPEIIVGQSLGEVAAAHVAGALTLREAMQVVYHRSRLMKRVEGQGLTALIGLPREQARLVLTTYEDLVGVAGASSPNASLISGEPASIERIVKSLERQGTFARVVKGVQIALHSPQMEALRPELVEALEALRPQATNVPLFSTVTGSLIDGAELNAAYWGRNLREPFLFADAVHQLAESGYRMFLEVAPHPVLGGSIVQCFDAWGKTAEVWPSLRRDEPELEVMLGTLAGIYTQGLPCAWEAVQGRGDVIPLPHYPWQREHYWLDQFNWHPRNVPVGIKSEGPHPLLGKHVASAVYPYQHVWEMDLTLNALPYLKDHQVRGLTVLPGAAYLEIALTAAKLAFRTSDVQVEAARFMQILPLIETAARRLHVVLTPGMPGEAVISIFSAPEGASQPWTAHAEATVRTALNVSAPAEVFDVQGVATRCAVQTTAGAHYARMAENGLVYGPVFQGVQALASGVGEALGKLQIHADIENQIGDYVLHPAVLDAALQVVAGAIPQDPMRKRSFLPAGVQTLRVWQGLTPQVWCHVTLRPEAGGTLIEADLNLYTPEGVCIATLSGLQLQQVAARPEVVDDAMYQIQWSAQALTPVVSEGRRQSGSWVVFAGGGSWEAALCAGLAAAGERVVTVRAGAGYSRDASGTAYTLAATEWGQYAQVLQEALPVTVGPCRGIVFGWPGPGADVAALEPLGVGGLVGLAQALGRVRLTAQPRVWVVTEGGQAVMPGEAVDAVQAGQWGVGRVLMHEQGDARWSLVDVAADGGAQVLAEVLGNAAENQVAWRGATRSVARLTRLGSVARREGRRALRAGEGYRLELGQVGDLESVVWRACAREGPGPGEVEVAVTASGLNFKDVMHGLGYLESAEGVALGLEFAGRVTALGPGVPDTAGDAMTDVALGDLVCGLGRYALGGYVVTDRRLVVACPAWLSAAAAGGVLVAYATAEYALAQVGRLQAGERVLIHTASGGLGLAAVQVARALGAEVYATAGTAEKRAYLREAWGIAEVYDSRRLTFAAEVQAATGGAGVSVVLNTLAGAGLVQGFAALGYGGRLVDVSRRDIVENHGLPLGALGRDLSYAVVDLAGLARAHPERVSALWAAVVARVGAAQAAYPVTAYAADAVGEGLGVLARGGHVGKLVVTGAPTAVAEARGQAVRIRGDGTYLVTGAFGGVGQAVVEWLVRGGAGCVVLASRRGAAGLSAAEAGWVARWGGQGTRLEVVACDVSDGAAVAGVVGRCGVEWPALRGVFHAAAVLADGLVGQMTAERLARVLGPKVWGTWHLHEATRGLGLDYFVLFSSLAAVLGNVGQANYAAGNAFMDGLAHARRAQGLPALSINWGPWSVGMAARQDLAEKGFVGMAPLSPESGLAIMQSLLQNDVTNATACLFDWDAFAQLPNTVALPFGQLVADLLAQARATHSTTSASSDGFVQTILRPAPGSERARLLERYLCEIVARVCRLDPMRVDARQAFNRLGIDSIMAVELKTKLETALVGTTVQIADLLGDNTVAGLAERFLKQLGLDQVDAEIESLLTEMEQLSEEEQLALLRGDA